MEKINKCDLSTTDSTRDSIMFITFHEIDPRVDQIDEYFDLQAKIIKEHYTDKLVAVLDASKSKMVNSKARTHIAERSEKHEKAHKNKLLKTFLVLPNPLIRLVVKGINAMTPPVIPQTLCKSVEEAFKLAEEEVKTFETVKV